MAFNYWMLHDDAKLGRVISTSYGLAPVSRNVCVCIQTVNRSLTSLVKLDSHGLERKSHRSYVHYFGEFHITLLALVNVHYS